MRSAQVLMLTLCVLIGLLLLTQAPAFFLPDRWDPAFGRQFDTLASRLLGAALLTFGWLGGGYLYRFYYRTGARRLRSPHAQRRHFALMLLALSLVTAAFVHAPRGPNPDYRPPAAAR